MQVTLYHEPDAKAVLLHLLKVDSIWDDGGEFEFTGYVGLKVLQDITALVSRHEPTIIRWHVHGLEVDRWVRCTVLPKSYHFGPSDDGKMFPMRLTLETVGEESFNLMHSQRLTYVALFRREQEEYAAKHRSHDSVKTENNRGS